MPFLVIAIALFILICLLPDSTFARAGGGSFSSGGFSSGGSYSRGMGQGGSGGFFLVILLFPLLLIYLVITKRKLNKKTREGEDLMAQLEKRDTSWDLNKAKERIVLIYFKVQEAWTRRDQKIARPYVSDRLYTKHKIQTDQLIGQSRQNVLENVNLQKAQIVEVADFKDDTKDSLWVYIQGSMIDYTIDTNTGKRLFGNANVSESFRELWKFLKNDQGEWVLDEIDQDVEYSDLAGFKSHSEALPNRA